MAMSYIKIHFDMLDQLSGLSDEQFGRLMRALLKYARGDGEGAKRMLKGPERFVYPVFRLQIDRDRASYDRVVESRRAAGRISAARRKQVAEAPDEILVGEEQ